MLATRRHAGRLDSDREDDLYARYILFLERMRLRILRELDEGAWRDELLQLATPVHREHFEARLPKLKGSARDFQRFLVRLDAPLLDAPLLDAPLLDAPLLDAPLLDAPLLDAPLLDGPLLDGPLCDY